MRTAPTGVPRTAGPLATALVVVASGVLVSCGLPKEPSDAPGEVPAALVPAGYRPVTTQVLYRGYTALISHCDGGDYDGCESRLEKGVWNWYTRRLGASITSAKRHDGTIAFRRYRGRYSGEVQLGGAQTVGLPNRRVEMDMRITLDNPRGSITSVPGDFPVHPDMDADPDTPPTLQQSWCAAGTPMGRPSHEPTRGEVRAQRKAVAFYRRTLGDAITDEEAIATDYSISFDDVEGVSGSVTVQQTCVAFDISRPRPG